MSRVGGVLTFEVAAVVAQSMGLDADQPGETFRIVRASRWLHCGAEVAPIDEPAALIAGALVVGGALPRFAAGVLHRLVLDRLVAAGEREQRCCEKCSMDHGAPWQRACADA